MTEPITSAGRKSPKSWDCNEKLGFYPNLMKNIKQGELFIMKKLLSLALALMFVVTAFASVSVSAEDVAPAADPLEAMRQQPSRHRLEVSNRLRLRCLQTMESPLMLGRVV